MTDIVEYVREHDDELGEYDYLSQYAPDAEGMRFNDEFPFDRMNEIYDLEPVWGGISGERHMREYMDTDLLEGNVTEEHFERGFTREELNDLQNYYAWTVYDILALRATEGRSEIIPRQEYESLSFSWAGIRWPEFFKALIHAVGLEGIMDVGRASRKELGTAMTSQMGWVYFGTPSGGAINFHLLDLISPGDPVYNEQRRAYQTVGSALMYATFGETGKLFPSQDRYVNQIKDEDVIGFVTDNLVDLEGEEKASFRGFNAATELLSFLMHYDNRVGLVDHGPYLVEDGKPMVMRSVQLNRPFLPWNDIAASRDLPNAASIALVIDPDAMDLKEIRCPLTTMTAPANYIDAVEQGAVFIREEPDGVEPLPPEEMDVATFDRMDDIAARANDAVSEWYERTAELPRRTKIMNGASTYYVGMLVPLLRKTGALEYFEEELDLWEMPPIVSEYYYMMMDGFATEQVPLQMGMGYGWEDYPEEEDDESTYVKHLEEAREMKWKSDLTGLKEVPDYWAERMDEHDLLEVPPTRMEGEVDRSEAGDFLANL